MGTTIHWDQVKPFRAYKDVSIYMDKNDFNHHYDFISGILDPEDYEMIGTFYTKRGMDALAINGLKHNNVYCIEYVLAYLIDNNPQIINFDQLMKALKKTVVISSRNKQDTRNFGCPNTWDVFYLPLSSGDKGQLVHNLHQNLIKAKQLPSNSNFGFFSWLKSPQRHVSTMLSYEEVKLEEIKEKIIC